MLQLNMFIQVEHLDTRANWVVAFGDLQWLLVVR